MERLEKERPIDYAGLETLEDLEKIKLYKEVGWGKSEVSEFPLVSFGYHYCNAIALSNGRKAGLSHTGFSGAIISHHLDKMIKDFNVPPQELKAVLVGGAGTENVRKYCKDRDIEVVSSYHDDRYLDDLDRMFYYPRDVLVIPSLGEVIIYTHKGKIPKFFNSYLNFPKFRVSMPVL